MEQKKKATVLQKSERFVVTKVTIRRFGPENTSGLTQEKNAEITLLTFKKVYFQFIKRLKSKGDKAQLATKLKTSCNRLPIRMWINLPYWVGLRLESGEVQHPFERAGKASPANCYMADEVALAKAAVVMKTSDG